MLHSAMNVADSKAGPSQRDGGAAAKQGVNIHGWLPRSMYSLSAPGVGAYTAAAGIVSDCSAPQDPRGPTGATSAQAIADSGDHPVFTALDLILLTGGCA